MKINGDCGEGSVNSLSNEQRPGGSAGAKNGKERAMPLNVTGQEEREPKREELQRIIQLMDGFKASKVSLSSHFGNVSTFNGLHGDLRKTERVEEMSLFSEYLVSFSLLFTLHFISEGTWKWKPFESYCSHGLQVPRTADRYNEENLKH